MLEIKSISKSFKNQKLFSELNITFPSRGLVSILGKSGSGKTTLLYLIAGYIKYDSGNIMCDNLSYNSLNNEEFNYLKNNYFGYVFQNDNLIDTLTVYENIKLSMDINCNENISLIDETLNKLGIIDKKDELVCNLSGGELKRVSIARALCKDSKVILCDEPTSSLDEENTIIILDLLKDISRDKLVILVSHDVEYVEKYSDEILYLRYGKLIDHRINNENDKSVNNIEIKKKKINIKTKNQVSKKILNKQLFRSIFTVIFLTIFVTLSLFLSVYNSYDRTNVLYKALKNSNNDGYFITNIATSLPQNSTEIIDNNIDFESFNIKTNKYYSYNNFNLASIDYRGNSNETFFKYVIIKDSLKKNEVIITRYTYNILEEYISNDSIVYNDITLKIIDIIELENDEINDRIYMNEETYRELFYSAPNMYKTSLNDSAEFDVVRRSFSDTVFDEYNSTGSTSIENNEILIGSGVYHYLTNTEFDSTKLFKDNYKDVIGDEIKITLFDREYTFVIKGVVLNSTLYISDEMHSIIYNGNNVDFEDLNYGYFCELNEKRDFIKFEKYLFENEKYIAFENSDSLYTMSYSYQNIVKIFKLFFIGLLLMVFLMIFYFIKNMIKENMKKIGILKTLGMNTKDLSFIFLISFVKLYIISFIISFVASFVLIVFENYWLRNDYKLDFYPISYNFIWLLVMFISSIVMILLVFGYTFNSLKKKDDIEIIKN